jgi:small subunit ribosomal protein S7
MQAGKLIPGRDVFPDALYNDKLVEKLVNYVMLDGKKSTARRIVYDAFNIMEQKTGESPLEVFNKAIKKLMPSLETRSRRVGGSTYQVPYEVVDDRQRTLALRWLMMGSRARNERTMAERLAAELMDATNEQGKAYEKRLDTHRMAEANRPFAHYRW